MHTGELNQICENETPDAVIETEVSLKVPKFTFNVEVPLKEHMKRLGVKDLFEKGKANLKKMSSLELYVDEIIHIANINVSSKHLTSFCFRLFKKNASNYFEKIIQI